MSQEEPQIQLIDDFLGRSAPVFDELRDSVEWDTSMAARQTASFGEPYNFSQMVYEARPFHPALVPIAEKLQQTLDIEFNNCLLNYYLTGSSTMGFHSDRTDHLQPGTGVAIVSLGSTRGLTFAARRTTGFGIPTLWRRGRCSIWTRKSRSIGCTRSRKTWRRVPASA